MEEYKNLISGIAGSILKSHYSTFAILLGNGSNGFPMLSASEIESFSSGQSFMHWMFDMNLLSIDNVIPLVKLLNSINHNANANRLEEFSYRYKNGVSKNIVTMSNHNNDTYQPKKSTAFSYLSFKEVSEGMLKSILNNWYRLFNEYMNNKDKPPADHVMYLAKILTDIYKLYGFNEGAAKEVYWIWNTKPEVRKLILVCFASVDSIYNGNNAINLDMFRVIKYPVCLVEAINEALIDMSIQDRFPNTDKILYVNSQISVAFKSGIKEDLLKSGPLQHVNKHISMISDISYCIDFATHNNHSVGIKFKRYLIIRLHSLFEKSNNLCSPIDGGQVVERFMIIYNKVLESNDMQVSLEVEEPKNNDWESLITEVANNTGKHLDNLDSSVLINFVLKNCSSLEKFIFFMKGKGKDRMGNKLCIILGGSFEAEMYAFAFLEELCEKANDHNRM